MKFLGERSMRGQFEVTGGNAKKQLLIEDGLINQGYRVKSFEVWFNQTVGVAYSEFQMILTMDTLPAGPTMDAGDNRQIAWAFEEGVDNTAPFTAGGPLYRSIVDPDHIAVRDLFIQGKGIDGTYNYLIVIEKVELTDDEAIIQIIKEESQSLP